MFDAHIGDYTPHHYQTEFSKFRYHAALTDLFTYKVSDPYISS